MRVPASSASRAVASRAQATAAGRGGPVEALLSYYGLSSDGPQIFNDAKTGQVDTNESSLVHQVSGKLNVKGVALDAANYRDAPPGLRIWCGATVDTADIEALGPWLDWAYATAKGA